MVNATADLPSQPWRISRRECLEGTGKPVRVVVRPELGVRRVVNRGAPVALVSAARAHADDRHRPRRTRRHIGWSSLHAFLSAIAFALVLAVPALGSSAPIIDPSDGLRLATLLSDAEATGILRLTGPVAATDVVLTAGPLAWGPSADAQGPRPAALEGVDLDRSSVTFDPKTPTLLPGRPTDVKVTVKGFKYSGIYSGVITISYIAVAAPSAMPSQASVSPPPTSTETSEADSPELESRTLPLIVVVTDPAAVGLLALTAPVRVVKTTCAIDIWIIGRINDVFGSQCALTRVFVAPIELTNKFVIDVRNQGQDDVELTDPAFSFVGRQTGRTITADAVRVTLPGTRITGGQIGHIELAVDRDAVAPDTYDGALTFVTTGSPARTSISLIVQMRRGAFDLLMLIVAGVAIVFVAAKIGRLAQEHADAQSGFAAVEQVFDVAQAEDKVRVQARVDNLRAAAGRFKWGDSQRVIAGQVVSDLDSLRIARELQGRIEDEGFPETRAKINAIREFVTQGKSDSAAKAALEAISAYASEVPARAFARAEWAARGFEMNFLAADGEGWARRSRLPLSVKLPGLPPFVQDRLIRVAWLVVRFGALAVFVVFGLRIAYVDAAATFTGASWSDTVPLIAYGMGSDVVARYLGGLVKPKTIS